MGAVCANDYAEKIKACIEKDRLLTERFHQLLDGKWDGMALSEHIGFVNWNDEGVQVSAHDLHRTGK